RSRDGTMHTFPALYPRIQPLLLLELRSKGEAPGRAVSSHAKSTPTVTATPVISAAATREIPIRSNQADFGHSSVPINEIGTHSASASPNDDQSVVVAKIAPDLKGVDPEASMDVIVQFKNDATDLTADGATAKSDLPLNPRTVGQRQRWQPEQSALPFRRGVHLSGSLCSRLL